MTEAFICDAIRTPIGRFGGGLSLLRTDDLAALPLAALLARNPSLDPTAIDEVFLGCANQAGEDNRNVARMAALLAGLPVGVPGTTLNRLCASGADAVGSAARAVISGEIELAIVGGVESMSRAPYVMAKAEKPFSREMRLEDTVIGWRLVNAKMQKLYGTASMPETGDKVAERYGVSRAEQDLFAMRSQQRAKLAQSSGYYADEIVPVTVQGKKGDVTVAADEHPRPDTTLEALAKLNPVVRPGGSVTAGNASGVNDGAAAMLIASAAAARRHGLTPRAHSGHGHGGGGAGCHGYRPGARRPEADGAAGAWHRRFRPDRTERGLRVAGHRFAARAGRGPGSRAHQPAWRRHCARPSAWCLRRTSGDDRCAWAGNPRRQARFGYNVYRRRAGAGAGDRTVRNLAHAPHDCSHQLGEKLGRQKHLRIGAGGEPYRPQRGGDVGRQASHSAVPDVLSHHAFRDDPYGIAEAYVGSGKTIRLIVATSIVSTSPSITRSTPIS